MTKIIESSFESVSARYRELAASVREVPFAPNTTLVGLVDSRGQAYRFEPEETVSEQRLEALLAILSRAYAPRVIYAVHH